MPVAPNKGDVIPELSLAVLRRLVLARFLYNQAFDQAVSRREITAFAAINLLQDAIEIFFLAAADYLNAEIGKKTDFEQYIDKVNDRLGDRELPFRRRLIEINKVRVLSKHEGIPPNASELTGYLQAGRDFFEQATELIFERPFWTVSLADLLPAADEARKLLTAAEKQFHGGRFAECLATCRKVLFIKYEWRFDIEGYRDGKFDSRLLHAGILAPNYACSSEYIANHVATPFDYIQLTDEALNPELLKDGIDPETYWNIWRLTPDVYRSSREGADWFVKHEPRKLDPEGIRERVSYVLDSTTDIALRFHARQKALRTLTSDWTFPLELKNPGAIVYRKADISSEVVGIIPEGADVRGSYRTPSFDRTGNFWWVRFNANGHLIMGYASDADVAYMPA